MTVLTVTAEATLNGRRVTKGTELSVRGARGRYRFVKLVTTDAGIIWLDVWGGPRHHETMRSFRPDRVKTVHRIAKTPTNLLAARRAA